MILYICIGLLVNPCRRERLRSLIVGYKPHPYEAKPADCINSAYRKRNGRQAPRCKFLSQI